MSEHPRSIETKSFITEAEAESLRTRYPHLFGKTLIDPTAFIAPGAQVLGDVVIGKESSIWHQAIIRGDVNYIRIGERTNIQDLSMVHVAYNSAPAIIGDDVTIGHTAIIHACTIGNFSLIGMGSIVLDHAEIGDFVLVGAGTLITQKTKIPSYSKVLGRPGKVVAELTPQEVDALKFSADHYVKLAKAHRVMVSSSQNASRVS